MSARFAGQVCLITGAAGAGIGQATARRLGSEGAVIAVTDVHEGRTASVTDALREEGIDAAGWRMDVADRSEMDRVVAEVAQRFGRIDILVNNAAVNVRAPFHEVSPEQWDEVVNIDLSSCWYLARAVYPGMLERRTGSIVNVSTVASWIRGRTESPYAAAKAGLQALTRTIAQEGGPHGIRCNAVAPGIVQSKFLERHMDSFGHEIEATPLGRFARPEEIASVIAFLASADASYVTGETLSVAGGWYMHA